MLTGTPKLCRLCWFEPGTRLCFFVTLRTVVESCSLLSNLGLVRIWLRFAGLSCFHIRTTSRGLNSYEGFLVSMCF